MTTKYRLWYRDPWKAIHNILVNPELVNSIDYIPYCEFVNDKRRYCDFMSGDWAWDQCVSKFHEYRSMPVLIFPQKDVISIDIDTHGVIFIPVILGSDKTTVSVATGQHEYHPIYLSIGNVHNHVRQAHKDALVLIGFLPIPKGKFSIIFQV